MMQGQQRQFMFDQILVAKSSSFSSSNSSSVSPAVLIYERKCIYAGPNGNWKLNLKDLFSVGVEKTTTTRTTSSGQHQNHHRCPNSHGGGGGRGLANDNCGEAWTLTLSGRKISLKCIARMNNSNSYTGSSRGGGRDNDRQRQLEEFIEGLKSLHRRMMTSSKQTTKHEDDYDRTNYHRLETSSDRHRQQLEQQQHHHQQQLQARKRVQVVTPAQHGNHKSSSALFLLSPEKKKHPTSGVFQSPARSNTAPTKSSSSSSIRHADHQSKLSSLTRRNHDGEGYAHYDPAMDEEVENFQQEFFHKNDTADSASSVSGIITGNVVPSPSSSAVRKLDLPSCSPRNASPVKLRKSMSKLPSNNHSRRLGGRQLHGISGGDIRLRERVGDDDNDDEFEFRDEAKEESEGAKKQIEEQEDDTTSIRQRLQKRVPDNEEDDDGFNSDGLEEEEEGVDENGRGVKKGLSRCKKKLRMSIDDDDDDGDGDDDDEEVVHLIGQKKLRMSINDDDDKEEEDDGDFVKSTDDVDSTEDKSEATQGASSISGVTLSSKEKVPSKKEAIANFFAPRNKSATTMGIIRHDSSPQSSADTYGATLLKIVPPDAREDRCTTPPHPSITPVPKLTQRKKNTSKYFSSVKENFNPSHPPSPQTLHYSSDGGEGEEDREEEESHYQTTRDQLNSNFNSQNNAYRRRGVLGLGHSRLGNRLENYPAQNKSYPHRGLSSNSFDFDRYKATPYAFNSVGRRFNLNKVTSSPVSSSPSKADLALGSGRKSTGGGIFIRPLNNENKPPAKAPSPTVVIPGIQNLGNTCYLSASLQTLFGIPSFIADLCRMYELARSATSTEETMPLTRALLEVAVVIGVLPEENASCISPEAARITLTSSLAANPSALKKRMDVLTDKFAGYEQRDAHEFLSDLVDYLHDELTASKSTPPLPPPPNSSEAEANTLSTPEGGRLSPKENKHPNEVVGISGLGIDSAIKCHSYPMTAVKLNNEDIPTDAYFHLSVRVCLECDSCGYSRSKDEMYRHLSVDVGEDSEQDVWTVERSLKQFFQPEKREIKCDKCKSGKTATQTMEVLSRPKALLLHFKRFIVTQEKKAGLEVQNDDGTSAPPIMEMILRKNKAKILLEETLSIKPFGGNTNQILPRKYHLRGVVHHVGNTAFSGHYTTCAKRTLKRSEGDTSDTNNAQDNEEQWVLFDDRSGTRQTASYVLQNERNQRNCYMALYELK